MLESFKKITNPLTVIAIFAGLAEVSGTTILPFIAESNQSIYIWFLMLFPIFLVAVFFITLNWNPRVLYAPSDFKDESNYMKLFQPSSLIEVELKRAAEIQQLQVTDERDYESDEPNEAEDDDNQFGKNVQSDVTDNVSTSRSNDSDTGIDTTDPFNVVSRKIQEDKRFRYQIIESLVIDKLAERFKSYPMRQMRLILSDIPFTFDAIFERGNELIIVEVKMLHQRRFPRGIFIRTLSRLENSLLQMPIEIRSKARLIIAIALEAGAIQEDRLMTKLLPMVKNMGALTKVELFSVTDLLSTASPAIVDDPLNQHDTLGLNQREL